ncbi:MAG: sulfite exporter TauE/SafE family protein [Rhodothermales bacterium]|nr:sulfite exporter TauE/SafE family protein [Rhodothermales bacterium]
MSLVTEAILMALAGAMHCVAMCGGLALIVSRPARSLQSGVVVSKGEASGQEDGARRRGASDGARNVWIRPRFLVYGFGKALTYGTLGLIVGLIGAVTATLQGGQQMLTIVAGVVLIAVGLHLAGVSWLSRMAAPIGGSHLIGWMAGQLRGRGVGPALALGMLNGLLPCGLVYGALAAALAQGSVAESSLFMVVFGAGTVPALWLSTRLAGWVSIENRILLARLSGVLLVLYGAFTLLRGSTWMHDIMQALGPG